MKKNEKKILPFPPPPEPAVTTIIAQIGGERFAIHFQIEDLPPEPPIPPQSLLLERPVNKRKRVE